MMEGEKQFNRREGQSKNAEKISAALENFQLEIGKKPNWSSDSLDGLRSYLISRHPGSAEEIQVMCGLVQQLFVQRQVDKQRESGQFRYNPDTTKHFAEFNYLLSHYFANLPKGNKEYAENFWKVMGSTAERFGLGSEFRKQRSGTMAQAALYKTMKELGRKPKLSTPKEDVYYKVDMWVPAGGEGAEEAIQLKTANVPKDIILEESEWLDFPSVNDVSGEQERHFVSGINSFSVALDKYRKEVKKDVKAWFVVLPRSGFDINTGDPNPELIADFKEKLGGLDKKN